jgi:hypothetical protein
MYFTINYNVFYKYIGWSSTSDRNFLSFHNNFYHERKITRAFPTTHVSTYFYNISEKSSNISRKLLSLLVGVTKVNFMWCVFHNAQWYWSDNVCKLVMYWSMAGVSRSSRYEKMKIKDTNIYYEFSLLHIFSLVLQPWMSAYIRKTDGVYISVPKND